MSASLLVNQVSNGILLGVVVGIPVFAAVKRLNVLDSFTTGAKDGITITVKIIPMLVAMLTAIGMFRASGGLDLIASALQPLLQAIGLPVDVLPLALIRPFSGSAANGMLAEIVHTHGGDAYISHLAATMMGSTETTFYILAVYFGSQGIRRTRHAVPVGLAADFIGILAAVVVCRWLLL
jgi:spore maturation protein B